MTKPDRYQHDLLLACKSVVSARTKLELWRRALYVAGLSSSPSRRRTGVTFLTAMTWLHEWCMLSLLCTASNIRFIQCEYLTVQDDLMRNGYPLVTREDMEFMIDVFKATWPDRKSVV